MIPWPATVNRLPAHPEFPFPAVDIPACDGIIPPCGAVCVPFWTAIYNNPRHQNAFAKTSEDPYLEVGRNPDTKETEVVFANPNMVTDSDAVYEVQNEPGAALPGTGGPGTNLICLPGSMMLALAGTGLLMQGWPLSLRNR